MLNVVPEGTTYKASAAAPQAYGERRKYLWVAASAATNSFSFFRGFNPEDLDTFFLPPIKD